MVSKVDQYIVYQGNAPASVWGYKSQAVSSANRLSVNVGKETRVIKHTTVGEKFVVHVSHPPER